MGWRVCDPVGNPTLRGTPHGDARFVRPCRLFRIASRAPSAPEYFSDGDQHEVFMNGQCRTLCLCRTDRDMPCSSRSAVARVARSFALSCRCTGSIPISTEAAIMKSDAISCPPRGLSHGEAILYVGVGSMLLMRWSRMGACPDLSASMIYAIWDLHQLDCRISVKIAGRQLRSTTLPVPKADAPFGPCDSIQAKG